MAAAAAAAGGPPPHRLEVAGLLKAPAFHVAKKAAESLKKSFPTKFAEPIILPLMEFAWNEYLQEKKKELRGEMWAYPARVMCFTDGQLLGDEDALLAWSSEKWDYKDPKPKAFYEAVASDFCINYLQNPKHDFAYLDIAIQDEAIGRLVFELFSSECPKTCTNFQTLCTGSAGISPSGVRLHYKDSAFHRLVKNGWLQGGDITSGKGDGGESIYGPTFEDENFSVSHKRRGTLGMANKGRHSNGSQFYITLQPAPYLDRKYVAFGQLIEGTEVLQKLEEVATCNERPVVDCKIMDCGVLYL
ncbi:probable inactive peptidyl-prolyl cis-trans isomerase-like 6 isoform X4 [Ornithorhynchus anatinus]|uniref:probable inactive peptidyl-prolyl cis-trans isomerase-like 6 isoform X4 n=1 Tax=Ornithorhynchus anatinus TaxID=9258 RepID=UPI0019D494EE|nr:probable inactive peptidyl-prolyl cis-trans isomerase-like 6 isoform X4 [Ornithorhynchus anatinus]